MSVPLALSGGALMAVAGTAGIVAASTMVGAFNIAAAKGVGILIGKTVDFVARCVNGVAQSPKQPQAAIPKV